MATFPSLSSSSLTLPLPLSLPRRSLSFPLSLPTRASRTFPAKPLLLRASNSSSFGDDLSSDSRSSKNGFSKKSVLSNLIHEIEPLDVSLIQKDVPAATVDAMKRTISGMLGLLPSDQFQVLIESLWEPLSKLLVSSMMTGYTLRNAEYRLCLEKSLDAYDESLGKELLGSSGFDVQRMLIESANSVKLSGEDELSSESGQILGERCEDLGNQGVEDHMSPEAQEFVRRLQSQLSSVQMELDEVKRKSEALQMQQLVGEEKNDLLDYLRSLQPEKVAELSEPTSPELKETIHSVVHGLLATLSPKMHSTAPPLSGNNPTGTASAESEDCAEIVENTSLQFHPLISLTRDYLARLLFWCMLLGHYVKGLEYRMELIELLSLTKDIESDSSDGKQAA